MQNYTPINAIHASEVDNEDLIPLNRHRGSGR